MDSYSLDKALNLIFNTLPRTVAPLGAISYSEKNQEKIWQKKNVFTAFFFSEIAFFNSRLAPFNGFFFYLIL